MDDVGLLVDKKDFAEGDIVSEEDWLKYVIYARTYLLFALNKRRGRR